MNETAPALQPAKLTIDVSAFKVTDEQAVELLRTFNTPGFKIFQKIMDLAVEAENKKVMQIDPGDPNFTQRVCNQQIAARAANTFCTTVASATIANVNRALQMEKETELRRIILADKSN